jgi:hypothetical protein
MENHVASEYCFYYHFFRLTKRFFCTKTNVTSALPVEVSSSSITGHFRNTTTDTFAGGAIKFILHTGFYLGLLCSGSKFIATAKIFLKIFFVRWECHVILLMFYWPNIFLFLQREDTRNRDTIYLIYICYVLTFDKNSSCSQAGLKFGSVWQNFVRIKTSIRTCKKDLLTDIFVK